MSAATAADTVASGYRQMSSRGDRKNALWFRQMSRHGHCAVAEWRRFAWDGSSGI
jgi:hypothetical protein